jgi:hypothetical protein
VALLVWLVALFLGVILPVFFLSNVTGQMSMNVVLIYSVILWATGRLVYSASIGKRRLTLMCFYIFVYTFFGVQPLLSVWTATFPHQPYPTAAETTIMIGLVVLGIAAFEVGYAVSKRSQRATEGGIIDGTLLRPRPVILSMLGFGITASLFLVLLVVTHYGANIFLGVRGGFAFTESEGPSMSQTESLLVLSGLRGLLASLLFISVYLWTRRQYYDWPKRAIWQLRLALIVLLVVNLVVSNPLSAARLWSGSLILTVLFMAARWRGARSFLVWATVACTALLGLFSALDPRRVIAAPLLRGEAITLGSTGKVILESVGSLQADGNFDAFQMLGLISQYADRVGYSFGRQLLLPLFFWIPRAVWPTKPLGTPDIVADSLNFFSLNVGAPLWAEGYMNLGVLGLVLILGVFGAFARISDDFLTRTSRDTGPMFPTIASSFFAANTIILLRGDLTSGTMYLQMVVGFTFAIILLMKRQTGNDRTPALRLTGWSRRPGSTTPA